jgi:CubicO group peptidase (beta-lactamase class C family)
MENHKRRNHMKSHKPTTLKEKKLFLLLCAVMLAAGVLAGCDDPGAVELDSVDYHPTSTKLWQVSTPAEQGLDPDLVAELYANAAQLPTTYSLLVFKNGYLIAEDYFHIGSPTRQVNIHSVTKSFTSALVGIAIREGCIESVDQKMMDFFPEYQSRITDPRKNQITIQNLLQMRAGFPLEDSNPELFELLATGFHTGDFVKVPLVRDPGTDSEYSNISAHVLGMIVERACDTDLKSFAQEHLFDPLGIEPKFWQTDWDGNYLGYSDLELSSTDLAKFGMLYLNDGVYDGQQIIPSDWVNDSLKVYSKKTWKIRVGRNWGDNGYGYQWWSIQAGSYRYNLAWGHGGQQIALIDDLDMMVVLLVDPLHLQWGDEPWRIEKGNLNLVADFVASLPKQ